MAVFRIEKTRDYTVMANHHLRNTATVAESEGAAVPHAILAGGLGLHHQRSCADMPGWSGQHLCYGPGAGGCGIHYP